MAELVSDVATPKASSYLSRTCAHFAHRVQVQRAGLTGTLHLPGGRCDLRADDVALHLRVTASDETGARQVADVVARHLVRFGSRDELRVTWRKPGVGGPMR